MAQPGLIVPALQSDAIACSKLSICDDSAIRISSDLYVTNRSHIKVCYEGDKKSVALNEDGAYYISIDRFGRIKVSRFDQKGDDAIEVVRDTRKPLIHPYEHTPVNIFVGDAYHDAGATAYDNFDRNISERLATVSNVDTSTPGTYTVTYNVTDLAGNKADEVVREVIVSAKTIEDLAKPVITLLGNNPVNVFVGESYVDAGATASDDKDGDITKDIIATGTVDTSTAGVYTVKYDVSDSSGNKADEAARTINVIVKPIDTDNDTIPDSSDNCPLIANSSQIDTNGNGVGDACETPAAVDEIKPVIKLLGNNPVNVFVGESYVDAGATASDDKDGDITKDIISVNPVNTSVVGTYVITYDVSDNAGNEADEATRTVNVIEKSNSDNHPTSGGGSISMISKFTPADGSVVIDNGADETSDINATLTLTAKGATKMAISNSSDFKDSSWEAFAATKAWKLTLGNGNKTVYVKFENSANLISSVYSDSIKLASNGQGAGDENGKVLGATSVKLVNDSIIQCKNSKDPNAVYRVKIVGGKIFLSHITASAFTFDKNLSWKNLIKVDSCEEYIVSSWIRINTGKNGVARPTDKVYDVNGDLVKHWLDMDKEQFYKLGGSEAAVFDISRGEMNSYKTGARVLVK